MPNGPSTDAVQPAVLIDLAVDAWKLARLFERVVARLVSIEGQPFQPGQAATPLNLDEFAQDDALVVAQMLEPIVMGPDGVLRMGTMLLAARARTDTAGEPAP